MFFKHDTCTWCTRRNKKIIVIITNKRINADPIRSIRNYVTQSYRIDVYRSTFGRHNTQTRVSYSDAPTWTGSRRRRAIGGRTRGWFSDDVLSKLFSAAAKCRAQAVVARFFFSRGRDDGKRVEKTHRFVAGRAAIWFDARAGANVHNCFVQKRYRTRSSSLIYFGARRLTPRRIEASWLVVRSCNPSRTDETYLLCLFIEFAEKRILYVLKYTLIFLSFFFFLPIIHDWPVAESKNRLLSSFLIAVLKRKNVTFKRHRFVYRKHLITSQRDESSRNSSQATIVTRAFS